MSITAVLGGKRRPKPKTGLELLPGPQDRREQAKPNEWSRAMDEAAKVWGDDE